MIHGRGRNKAATCILLFFLLASVLASGCGKKQEEVEPVSDNAQGVVFSLTGPYSIRLAAQDHWLAGSAGMSFYPGDTVWNGAEGELSIMLLKGYRVILGGNVLLTIDAEGDEPLIFLWVGKVRFAAGEDSGNLRVSTPATEITLESADASVYAEPGGLTTVSVEQGKATLGDAEKVTVNSSHKSSVRPGEVPSRPEDSADEEGSGLEGNDYLVCIQVDPFFKYEEDRDTIESESKAQIAVNPVDEWAHVNLGRALLDTGQVNEARSEFNRALEIDSQFQQALCGLGKVELKEGNWAQAADYYGRARRADRESVEAVMGAGGAALGTGDLAAAESLYKEVLDIDEGDEKALTALGIVKFLQGDFEGASSDLDSAISLESGLARAYRAKSMVSAVMQEPDDAKKQLEELIKADPLDEEAFNCLGLYSLRAGDASGAELDFKRLVDSEDVAIKAKGYQNQGYAAASAGNTVQAVAEWTKCIDLAPDNPPVMVDSGLARIGLGESGAGLGLLEGAVVLEDLNWYTHQSLAGGCMGLGLSSRAIAESRRGLELNPSSWACHIILGLSYRQAGLEEDWQGELSVGIELAPERRLSASQYALLGMAYQAVQDYDSALECYQAAVDLSPETASYHRASADALGGLDRGDEALAEYREAIEIEPGDTVARLSVSRMLYEQGDLQSAIEELETALEHDPGSVQVRWQLAEYLLQNDEVEAALYHLEQAKGVAGRDAWLASILVTEGNAYDRMEDFESAIAAYTQAIAVDVSRGDAWFYMAGDYERTGRIPEAISAYQKAFELCSQREEWKEFYKQSGEKLNQLQGTG